MSVYNFFVMKFHQCV